MSVALSERPGILSETVIRKMENPSACLPERPFLVFCEAAFKKLNILSGLRAGNRTRAACLLCHFSVPRCDLV